MASALLDGESVSQRGLWETRRVCGPQAAGVGSSNSPADRLVSAVLVLRTRSEPVAGAGLDTVDPTKPCIRNSILGVLLEKGPR
jgi:hypothetical protein